MVAGGCLVAGGLVGFPIPRIWLWEQQKADSDFEVIDIEEVGQDELVVEHCESTI